MSPRRKAKPVDTGGPARRRQVNEDAVASRYVKAAKMSVAECARSFGVSHGVVRAILDARGIEVRGKRAPDEEAVVTAYEKYRSVRAAAAACGIGDRKVREILGKRGIVLSEGTRPSLAGNRSARPTDKITVAEAARTLGKSRDFVGRAVREGALTARYDGEGRRYLIRGDVQAFGASLALVAPAAPAEPDSRPVGHWVPMGKHAPPNRG
ncbi:MAG: helix-turn-helix domain-containing protein [Nocardiopsaceae bacterium]|nr:helix-turn-helix domain-containing protein [Nocardiopsaceae bacterium]